MRFSRIRPTPPTPVCQRHLLVPRAGTSRHSFIGRAFAGFAAAVQEAREGALSAETRAVIRDYIECWDGRELGLSRTWMEHRVSSLAASPDFRRRTGFVRRRVTLGGHHNRFSWHLAFGASWNCHEETSYGP